mgnify:CR=1 FL=1
MKFYRCSICGRVEVLNDENDNFICCGKLMEELKPRSADASVEKHVPYCKIEDGKINVSVGEVLHPMSEEHYIVFIGQLVGSKFNKIDLVPNENPKATFEYVKGSKIYAYCNLHGLWKNSVK